MSLKHFTDKLTTLTKHRHRLYFFLIVAWLFGFGLWLAVKPGFFSPDSHANLEAARTGYYNTHHPPINAWVWSKLNQLIPDGSLLSLLQISLLMTAIAFFAASTPNPWAYGFFVLNLWPPLLIYGLFIWKDIAFSYSYLLVSAILTYHHCTRKTLPRLSLIPLCLLIFYGTAAKYQAQFVLPILVLWLVSSFKPHWPSFKLIIAMIIISVGFLFVIEKFNHHVVPPAGQTHSWQYVKLYDLAGISVQLNRDIVPEFYKTDNFSWQALTELYNPVAADRLFINVQPAGIYRFGTNQSERQALYAIWQQALLKHPWAYLKHRALIFREMSTEPILAQAWPRYVAKLSLPSFLNTLRFSFCALPWLLIASLIFLKTLDWRALPPLRYLTAMSLMYAAVLFFCSMASPPRYLYFSCLTSAYALVLALGTRARQIE